jgi:hypothetical protein
MMGAVLKSGPWSDVTNSVERVSIPPQAVGRPASGGRSLHSVVQTVLVAGNIVSDVVEGDAIRGHDGVVAQREQR